ncbi:Larval cuticle protein 65Ab2 [Pseudolycoriella hygida]|uniref:Larval cuticle protein 65Ab2 n=1 Tax=Pseudolycoriella hygida TaxID=35572 RepID=A0A9Q0MTR1_9DIPT|nr:Larval cuticle protein 65Ab2 [Pseudolycoriella hygida]
MLRFVLLSACVVLAASQQYHQNPQTAAIISEQRYLAGDRFGATYDTEDGTNFKEETDADGTRHGSYSYIDPSGEKRTVSYTAGKNGFQATGAHLPVAPAPPPHAQPQPQHHAPQQFHQQPQQFHQQPQQFSSNADNFDDGRHSLPSYLVLMDIHKKVIHYKVIQLIPCTAL